ncbi:tyrosine-protein phosphatase non-receptor type 4 isoform X2 [Strongylocentrotus purpuratus]|uniref:protein-tyrosine-phosphatase n=1 Tax=Strongylocentrotus purpuratus TaxID=7668 RepID=A0A7M7P7X1_STRPU|nr:tyrosine-protein phosphatase non-receptor type 4 isoform X2 [Strongylocentrotus purpuratus]
MAREKQERRMRCLVEFLDNSEEIFEVERRAKGQELLDRVFEHLELLECDYFGLRYSETENTIDSNNKRWLDPRKSIRKQVKGTLYFNFQVKFFVTDPSKLLEEYTRYQYVLQLKKDLLEGRLTCSFDIGTLLASYLVQAELGDYDPQDHPDGYMSQFRFIPYQTEEFINQVHHLHKANFGQLPADAEFHFLNTVKNLELYGVDLHHARDTLGSEIAIGVVSAGLSIFQNGVRINQFSWAKIVKISFKRKQFFIQQRREIGETRDMVIGFNMTSYRACKNLWKSCVEHHTFFRMVDPQPPAKRRTFFQLGSKFRYSGRTESQTMEDTKKRSSPNKRAFRRTVGGTVAEVIRTETRSLPSRTTQKYKPLKDNHRVPSFDGEIPPSPNGKPRENGLSKSAEMLNVPPQMTYMDDNGGSDVSIGTGNSYEVLSNGYKSQTNGDALVTIRMLPDDRGRFGFNVKGGADQGAPIIVSRVAPNTPADLCIPRLNEGDQILQINGKDASTFTNEQLVSTIRALGEARTKDLVLTVRPNVYVGEEVEEPVFQYIPESPRIVNGEIDSLTESFMLLQEGLDTGMAIAQFDQLYRKKPGMTMGACRLAENVAKNRYRDIAPYDATRVILREADTGDYINANTINMDIPGFDLVNKYVAAQGPLPNTVNDFWYMVWEQRSTLIVMLTTNVERGRVKCHKYWPDLDDRLKFGPDLEVRCTRCDETPSFAYRDFIICNTATKEERIVLQMQYVAWPDHGVPDDSSDFLDFVLRVRQCRVGMDVPTIVHCSAGIGRTGVLITMETAMCLIEANEPVYPLDIVRTERDQRPMLIQTAAQYKFVCEAIIRVYMDCIVKPIDEQRS